MKVRVDSLVRGKAGFTDRIVTGRVYSILRSGVAIITDDGRQAIIYKPEVLAKPRPLIARTDIPTRLR